VERHGADLEGKAGQHEDNAEQRAGGHAMAQSGVDRVELGRTGEAIGQADAEEQNARGQRTQHEILQTGFGRTLIGAQHGCQHVRGQRVHFETDIQREHIGGRDHDPHAQRRKQHQDREFGAVGARLLEELGSHDQRDGSGEIDQDLGVRGKAVLGELAREGRNLGAMAAQRQRGHSQHANSGQGQDRGQRDGAGGLVTAPCRDEQQQQPTTLRTSSLSTRPRDVRRFIIQHSPERALLPPWPRDDRR
jgi:hypothetical protein